MKPQHESGENVVSTAQVVGIALIALALSPLLLWGVLHLLNKPIERFDLQDAQNWLNVFLVVLTSTVVSKHCWTVGSNSLAAAVAITQYKMPWIRSRDPITGMVNRASFINTFERHFARDDDENIEAGLLLIDIDRFRVFTDSLGQSASDQLLRSVADRIQAVLRRSDPVARVSDTQFAVLAKGIQDENGLVVMARNILRAFSDSYPVGGRETVVSLSMGLIVVNSDSGNAEEVLRHADLAVRAAQRGGGGRYHVYQSTMIVDAASQQETELRLSRAAQRDEFRLLYQPIVDGKSGRVTAVEALLRWHDPLRGSVSPVEFIPIMEQSGQIVDIGLWVLRTACTQCVQWRTQDASTPLLSVNISPRQFLQKDFVDSIAQILSDTGLAPAQLQLEVTEQLLLDASPQTLEKVESLAALGIKLALDDFGLGNSSLSYLTKVPLHTLKIDRSFVKDVSQCARRLAVVRAIIDLGHGLDLHITAEGVETEAQSQILRELNCDSLQGFLFARPQSPEEIADSLSSQVASEKLSEPVTLTAPDSATLREELTKVS